MGLASRTLHNRSRVRQEEKDRETPARCGVGSGEKLIGEEAKDTCARLHSGIRLPVINKVNDDSKKDDNNSKINKTSIETKIIIGGSGFSMPSPDKNCEGSIDSVKGGGVLIDTQLSSDAAVEDGKNNDSTSGISGLNNNHKILIKEEAEDM